MCVLFYLCLLKIIILKSLSDSLLISIFQHQLLEVYWFPFFFLYHVFLNLFLFLYLCTDVYTFKDMVTSSNLYRLTSERQNLYQLASSGIMEGPAGGICKREGPAPGVHGEQTCY